MVDYGHSSSSLPTPPSQSQSQSAHKNNSSSFDEIYTASNSSNSHSHSHSLHEHEHVGAQPKILSKHILAEVSAANINNWLSNGNFILLERIQFASWVLKDMGWCTYNGMLSIPFGIIAISVQLLFTLFHLFPFASKSAPHQISYVIWLVSNFLWMLREICIDDPVTITFAMGTIEPLGCGLGGWDTNSWKIVVNLLFFSGVVVESTFWFRVLMITYKSPSNEYSDETDLVDDTKSNSSNRPVTRAKYWTVPKLGQYGATEGDLHILAWLLKDLFWSLEVWEISWNHLAACLAAFLTCSIGFYGVYIKLVDNSAILIDIFDPLTMFLWMTANVLWMISDVFVIGTDVYSDARGKPGDDFIPRLCAVLFFSTALFICQGGYLIVFLHQNYSGGGEYEDLEGEEKRRLNVNGESRSSEEGGNESAVVVGKKQSVVFV